MDMPDFRGTNRFKVNAPLGQGAMCLVYKATDLQHGDVVALKTLKHLDSNSLYRLKQEFRALSHLDHPNLVSFYELINSPEGWFVTMELVDGEDFLTWVRGKEAAIESHTRTQSTWASSKDLKVPTAPPTGGTTPEPKPIAGGTLPDMVRLRSSLRQIAEGISTLHAAGRIHRDLKPSNVMVTNAGRVVVLDFGLVADIDQDYTEGTLHQSIAGSAAYMSPEQSIGMPLSDASDWYSLGVMMYEALTGIWPFTGHLYEILTAKGSEDPVPPRILIPECPEELSDLCMAMLDREPDHRPSGAQILARLRNKPMKGMGGRPRLQTAFRFRTEQINRLGSALDYCSQGKAGVMVIRGTSGMGKTQLVREFIKRRKRSAPSLLTLKGRCFEWEKVDFKALDGLMDNLSRVLRRVDYNVIRRLANEDLSALAQLFPVLGRVDSLDMAPTSSLPPAAMQEAAYQSMVLVMAALAQDGPVILHIDDVHWGDQASAAFLARLLIENQRLPILCLLSHESSEVGPFVRWLIPQCKQGGVEIGTIDLAPISFDQSRVLVSEMLGRAEQDPVVLDLAGRSEGNPGVVRELVRQVLLADHEGEDKGALNEMMLAALTGLPAAPARLMSLLAVAGGTLPTDIAILASDLKGDAFGALSTLRAHHLIRVTGTHQELLTVSSVQISDWVVDQIEGQRASYALHLAQTLEANGGYDPALLVDLYVTAGAEDRAGTVAWMSADQALKAGRFAETIQLTERALKHGKWSARERRSMLKCLAHSLGMMGRARQSAKVYLQAVEGATPVDAARFRQLAAEQFLMGGMITDGLAILEPMLAEHELPALTSSNLLSGGLGLFRNWRKKRRGTDFQSKLGREVAQADLVKVDLAYDASIILAGLDPTKADALRAPHQEIALDIGETSRAIRALADDIRTAGHQDDPTQWKKVHQELIGVANKHRAWLDTAAARCALDTGEWDQAIELARFGEIGLRKMGMGMPWERMQARFVTLEAMVQKGELAQVATQTEPLLVEALAAGNLFLLIRLLSGTLIWPRIASGRAAASLDLLASGSAQLHGSVPALKVHIALGKVWADLALGNSAFEWLESDPSVRKLADHPRYRDPILVARTFAAMHAGDRAAGKLAAELAARPRAPLQAYAAVVRASQQGTQDANKQAVDACLRAKMPLVAELTAAMGGNQQAQQALAQRGLAKAELLGKMLIKRP